MLRTLLGCISLLLYILNAFVLAVLILLIALITFLIPVPSWRHAVNYHILQRTPTLFAYFNHLIMQISTRNKWDIKGIGDLNANHWYVMISNHRSWLDILILGNVFNHKIPPLKFFMKKELLWQIPLVSWACYVLGFPFMSRHSHAAIRKNPKLKGKDIETTKKACHRLRAYPTTLINFLEGTRFTPAKKERQQSPYQHLLKPHAGGVAIAMNELHDILSGVINVVIGYPKKTPTVWEFMCGRFEKMFIRYEVLPVTPDLIGDYYNDRNYRATIQQWLNMIWQRNDEIIDLLERFDPRA